MKKAEIVVGGKYWTKVSNKIVPVIVNDVRETFGRFANGKNVYDVTNTVTGRKLTFRSAAKFRSLVKAKPTAVKLELRVDSMHPEGI